ncbi:MAG TPA: fatty acid--CoA ligase family protein, partial [Candidatus Polarisedimenticolaceae bacterium]|nr:fatty acid--CoA ligase family protein [Candidatus Polarisedimenticolaceae bacterium]
GVEAADAAPLFTPTCYAYAVSQVLVQMLGRAPICPIRTGFKYPILILEAIDRFRLRGLSANPTSFKMLLKAAADVDLPLDTLRYAMGGGQFLSREVVTGMEGRFPGCRVVNQYGCTENSPRIAYHWVAAGEEPLPGKSLPVGKAVAGTEIRISDEGQVLVRGTSLMSRYWQMPEETARRTIEGWYATGDVGFLDGNGDLVLIGRLSDVINVGNEKVSPGEVEGFLEQAPGVAEAAVFGTDDPLLGEAVEAIVVPRDGHHLSPEDTLRSVRAHLKAFVSAYKMPRRVHLRKALPRNLYGKLDRSRLVAWARDEAS